MATCSNCIHQYCCKYDRFFGVDEVENKCSYFKNKEDTPTADVVEVKHGHWVDDIQKITTVAGVEYHGLVGYKCSLCGRREGSKEPYCNCGAKMDGVKEEKDNV